MLGKKGSNHYIKALELGLEKPKVSDETKKKLSELRREANEKESIFSKEKRKNTIRQKVKDGTWHVSLARNLHKTFEGQDYHGTWELEYAKFLQANGVS
jgi:hypothetical protein